MGFRRGDRRERWRVSPSISTPCRARNSSPTRSSISPRTCCARTDAREALVFRGEDKAHRPHDLCASSHALVSRLQQALRGAGRRAGDRVAGIMPNMPETIAAMLAAASLGAIWSSCSPDFGVQGVLDRFGQIEPKVLFAVDGYWYNGKPHRHRRQARRDRRASCRPRKRVGGRALSRRRPRRSRRALPRRDDAGRVHRAATRRSR